ncbi:MAG: 30S ribosomal protein S6 [Candidatus Bipolaricaulis sp.]|nr:30S ribosomal protein S6 [Candidatus Bipolaricaulis sp.]MDD5219182.1 30S ribosomal protein S6 [Candidatus Bipolaricaulis sp.]MDD5646662.1 30S ribosomal protein S6 [Candidatus Bipolaricaulis sp.]
MREYEIVYVIRPDLTDEQRSAKVERIQTLITENGGDLIKTEEWGRRVLAYQIRHFTDGVYEFTEFRLPPTAVKTIEERLNIDEELLRYQIVVKN